MFKNGEILTTLSKQVFLLKIADFPEYIRVDNTERWLSKWENLPLPQLEQKLSISLRLRPHFEQNMMTTFPKKGGKRPTRGDRVVLHHLLGRPLTNDLAFAVSDLFLP